jgi:hypothetical protein
MLNRTCETIGNIQTCTIGSTDWISDLANVLALVALCVLWILLIYRLLIK